MGRKPFQLNGIEIPPGRRASLSLPVPGQSSYTPLAMPVHVIHGRRDGPVLFVCAAIHGDEINGIEVIRQLLHTRAVNGIRGTLIAIPIVNVYGFFNHTRYLPDRRDLNRSFPGSEHGSLSSRVAWVFNREIVSRATHGIDLHTGANHRMNLPHIRANLESAEVDRLARAFGAPVVINANLRDGSLRQYAMERGLAMLLYEAGEALRFDPLSVRVGVRGILNVMRTLEMLPSRGHAEPRTPVLEAQSSTWVRAPQTGLLRMIVRLGARVAPGQPLGYIADAVGENEQVVPATASGMVVGCTNIPIVNEGDALFHIARFGDPAKAEQAIGMLQRPHIEGLSEGDYQDPVVF